MGKKKVAGAVGIGGVSTCSLTGDAGVRVAAEQLLMVPIDDLVPYANNARVHSNAQISQLRASLREFGFVTPVLIDFDNNVIAGHGRLEAARAEGLREVPCVLISNLTEAQRKAYILADNRLSEVSAWDTQLLKIELDGLEALHFDTGIVGFDTEALKGLGMLEVSQAAPGDSEEAETSEEYEAFVEKFKPKLTTDDCYTPDNVYACVRDWAVRRYGLEGAEVLRPFYPGGDYQNEAYPDRCVVIDNPPFSILSEICRFYQKRGVRFFLFAPALSLFSTAAGECNYLPLSVNVTYANGAIVNTSFVTNLGEFKIEVDPELYALVREANKESRAEGTRNLSSYIYPPELITSAGVRLARHGQFLRIPAGEAAFVRALDAQREKKSAIFGGGFLLSEKAAAEKAAAEKAAAEKAAAEKAAAEKAAAEKAAAEKAAATMWELSKREKELVRSLGKA